MPKSQAIAQALAGVSRSSEPDPLMDLIREKDSNQLEAPAIDPIMLLTGALGPSALRGGAWMAKDMAKMAPRLMTSEAGAIFPEGMAVPANKALAKEMGEVLTESQLNYKRNEALSNWHAQNYDWQRVLQDKWAMLKHAGGS